MPVDRGGADRARVGVRRDEGDGRAGPRLVRRHHGLRAVSLRYFNAAGASADGRFGEVWDRSINLVPVAMKAVLGRRPADPGVRRRLPHPRRHVHPRLHPRRRPRRRPRQGARLPRRRRRRRSRSTSAPAWAAACSTSSAPPSGWRAGRSPTSSRQRRAGDPVATYADPTLIGETLGWRPPRVSTTSSPPPGRGTARTSMATPAAEPGPAGTSRATRWRSTVVLGDGETATIRPIRPGDADRARSRSTSRQSRREHLPPLLLAQARALADRARALHQRRLRRPGRPRRRVPRRVPRRGPATSGGQGATTPTPRSWSTTHHQGKGIATLLLEHLAAIAASNGIKRFTAEVLADNRPMLAVFSRAGWPLERRYDSGVIEVDFPSPTPRGSSTRWAGASSGPTAGRCRGCCCPARSPSSAPPTGPARSATCCGATSSAERHRSGLRGEPEPHTRSAARRRAAPGSPTSPTTSGWR